MNPVLKIFVCFAVAVCLSAMGNRFVNKTIPIKIEYPGYFGNNILIPVDNPITQQGVYLGRLLFYEKALSANNQVSCATCHQQEHAFIDGKRFSTGFDGQLQPRNTMSLVNLMWVRRFFWDGRVRGLENQGEIPLTGTHEMGQSLSASVKKLETKQAYIARFKEAFGSDSITGPRILKALAQFERTLVSANSRYDKYLQGQYNPTASELNGMSLFYTTADPARNIRGAGCGHCHGGPKTYSELFHNNGLDTIPQDRGLENITRQEYDRGRFRVVTLRNIAVTAPYMHDGRFQTLEEVLTHYNQHLAVSNTLSPFLQNISNRPNGRSLDLMAYEKKDLVDFLNMLTDSSFIADKRFSNPF